MSNCTCNCHQAQPVKPTTSNDIARFWRKVDIRTETECWEWQGFVNPRGYGQWARAVGDSAQTHRWAYIFTHGEIPEGMMVDHLCHNRACANPSHFRLATPAENAQNRKGTTVRNTSGHRGVTWHSKAGKWQARAMKDGKYYNAGLYVNLEDAAAAATELRSQLYGRAA